jgi:hypothetical protein
MKIKSGMKLKARYTIRYTMGQISSDKISKGEIVTIDEILTESSFTLREHADRYGPWYEADFIKIKKHAKRLGNRYRNSY